MKITNFKMYPLMIAVSAFLALSGCDGTTGISSDTGIVASAPAPETPVPETPVPDAGTSTVTASPASVTADGTATSTITVTVSDASSNPIVDAMVTLSQTGSSTISTVTNVGDGTYTFEVSSTTVETVTYTATADGVSITQTTNVDFTQQTEAECLLSAGGYEAIIIKDTNDNNRTWLDRNLGASEVAAGPYDEAAFGHYYQWGRSADGHQEGTSDTNDTLATTLDGSDTNTDWYGKFILSNRTNLDWVTSTVDNNGSLRANTWSIPYDEVTNPNQVCPCGYIVPTAQDFVDLNLSNPANADIFKIAYTDRRAAEDGSIPLPTDRKLAIFWTTTHDNNDSHYYAMYFGEPGKIWDNGKRGAGVPVRCIKPLP